MSDKDQHSHTSLEKDIQDLQALVADQTKTIDDLSQELFAQQKDIQALRRQFEDLKSDIARSKEQAEGYDNASVKPPHY